MMLVGAPGSVSAHGQASGQAVRTWVLRQVAFPRQASLDAAAAATAAAEAAVKAAARANAAPLPSFVRSPPPSSRDTRGACRRARGTVATAPCPKLDP